MGERCTWVDPTNIRCPNVGKHNQVAKDGEVWAVLCDRHNSEINKSIEDLSAKKILRDWVRAQGGSKAAARRMMHG